MECPEVKALNNLRHEIVEKLDPTDMVLDCLREKQSITDVVYRRILKTKPRPEQSRMLIDEVKRKEIWHEFIDVLEISHKNLAKKLKGKITELKRNKYFPENICSLNKHPGQIDIMCGIKKPLSAISFKLRVLSNDGKHGLAKFDELIADTMRKYGNVPEVAFQMLDSVTAKNRLYYETGNQSDPLQQMERLVATVTHSDAASMTYLARKGSAIAMTGDLVQAIQYLEKAKAKSALIKPCKDTGMMMYSFVNVLMEVYEAAPTADNKQMLIDNLLEAIEVHFAQTPSKMRDEFSRIFFLKLAFCFLGMGVFGKVIGCEVTKDDIDAAQKCFFQIENIPGMFDNRRTMFIALAKAVMDYHSGIRFFPRAIHLAEDAKQIAIKCGFQKELTPIEDLLRVLDRNCPKYNFEKELEKDLVILQQVVDTGMAESSTIVEVEETSHVEVMDVSIEEGVGSEDSMDIDE